MKSTKAIIVALLIPFISFSWNEGTENCISVGAGAGASANGPRASAFGVGSAYQAYTFEDSCAMGYLSGKNSSVRSSVVIGTYAGYDSIGVYFTLLGCYAGLGLGKNEYSEHDIGIGYASLYGTSNAFYTVAIGDEALRGSYAVSNIVAIGHGVGKNTTGVCNRVWIDYMSEANPDNSAINISPTNFSLGKSSMPVTIRGMLRDTVNPEIQYKFDSGTCSVYHVYNTYTTNWYLYTPAGTIYPVTEGAALEVTGHWPIGTTFHAPPYTIVSVGTNNLYAPGSDEYKILQVRSDADVVNEIGWTTGTANTAPSSITPLLTSGEGIYRYSLYLSMTGIPAEPSPWAGTVMNMCYGYITVTHTDFMGSFCYLSEVNNLKATIKNAVLSVPVVDINAMTQQEAIDIIEALRNACEAL